MRKKEISMIILAGGASSRMGRDKSDLTIDGKTFLEMQMQKKLGSLSHSGHEEPLMGVYCTDLADAMLEEITERKGAVFAFLRKNGYECYESQVADWYFSNINDPETYKEIPGNHFIEKYV